MAKIPTANPKRGKELMKSKWMMYGAAALLLLTGCGKTGNNTNQTATNTPDANAAAPGQATTANPANEPAPIPEPPKPFLVPAGTPVPVILSTKLNSGVNKSGEEFEASLAAPIMVEGEEAIPKGASVTGTIVSAKKQGAVKGEATMTIKLTSVRVRGKSYLIATSSVSQTEKGKGKRSAVMTGGGAAVGALIGGLAGGGKGAAIGAGVGAGGGLAASAGTGGKNVEFPAESKITFKLSQSLTVDR
jgi:hypothetical protein